MKYFKIEEFTGSKLDNENFDSWQLDNVEELVDNLLDPLREAWEVYCKKHKLGTPALRISSGVRTKVKNEIVGGSKTSSHLYGYAADIVPYNGKLMKFKLFCIEWLKDKSFDQFISEDEDATGTPRWIHIGYKRYNGVMRRQFLKKLVGSDKYINI